MTNVASVSAHVISYVNLSYSFFFFNDPATTEIYPLSLHDALPISPPGSRGSRPAGTPEPPTARDRSPTRASSRPRDRKSTRLNSSHVRISYAVFCLKKKHKRSENWLAAGTEVWCCK